MRASRISRRMIRLGGWPRSAANFLSPASSSARSRTQTIFERIAPGFCLRSGHRFSLLTNPASRRAAKPGQSVGKEPASGFCTTKCVSCLTVKNTRNRLRSKKDGKRRGHEKGPGSGGENQRPGRHLVGKKTGSRGPNQLARPFFARSAPFWISFVRSSFVRGGRRRPGFFWFFC